MLCATNFILAGKGGYEISNQIIEGGIIWLKNDYGTLQIIVCFIGLISAMAWYCSIVGHEKWERNWMNIITYYERVGVYSILIVREEDINSTNKDNHRLQSGEFFKAFSTHRITKLFVLVIAIGWIFCLSYTIIKSFFDNDCNLICGILIFLIILFIIIVVICLCLRNRFYSDVEGKYWINKDRM